MTTTIDGFKPPEPEKVVCSDPKKLLAEIAAPLKAPTVQYWTNAVSTIQGYAEQVWERSGCSCEPHRERLAELDKEHAALVSKIADIDYREHPDLDALAARTKPWVGEWLTEQFHAKKITERDVSYAYHTDGSPYMRLFVKDVIAGWRPFAMRPNGGKP